MLAKILIQGTTDSIVVETLTISVKGSFMVSSDAEQNAVRTSAISFRLCRNFDTSLPTLSVTLWTALVRLCGSSVLTCVITWL